MAAEALYPVIPIGWDRLGAGRSGISCGGAGADPAPLSFCAGQRQAGSGLDLVGRLDLRIQPARQLRHPLLETPNRLLESLVLRLRAAVELVQQMESVR